MSAPVNLNRVRKARARDEKRREADQNAVAHGRTKAEKTAAKAAARLAERRLEGHKRTP